MPKLSRLLNPKTIALFGGSWAENVAAQLIKSSYAGEIWPVHPKRPHIAGIACYPNLDALPAAPDAAFIGVNSAATVEVMKDLSAMGAGGAICFASGFQEAGHSALQSALIDAAGNMPFLGPNCYGLINYLDNAVLWPDQHGGLATETGVGIIAQSSNIAINISMQKRGLPIGQIITIGNQAQTGISALIEAQTQDSRITAIGLYLEGFGDIAAFEKAANAAHAVGKPIVAIKAGASEKSQIAAMSHTASLAGSAAASSALLKRLGIAEVKSIAVFLETLKLLHYNDPLKGNRLSSVSCSGGEASLMADLAEGLNIEFPDFSPQSLTHIGAVLGEGVILANPLDYHTYIWGDVPKMTACFAAVMDSGMDLNIFVLDIPRADRCDPASFDCVVQAVIAARAETGTAAAVISLLPENIDEAMIARFADGGVVVLSGMETGLKAVEAACYAGQYTVQSIGTDGQAVWITEPIGTQGTTSDIVLSEHSAKTTLAEFGLNIPQNQFCQTLDLLPAKAENLAYPLVLKTMGLAHKTEAGGVILNIQNAADLNAASAAIPQGAAGYLLEEMQPKPVAELIIGVVRDATGLFVLTLGAGGIFTEILKDTASLVLPCAREDIVGALNALKINTLLQGFRGKPAANGPAIIDAVMAVQAYAAAHKDTLIELDINPLMANTHSAVAVDTLIRLQQT